MRPTRLEKPSANRNDWRTIRSLLPYLWEFKGRVVLALVLLVMAKLANVTVPLILKEIIDALDRPRAMMVLPVLLLAGYGILRLCSTLFGELRDAVFAKVTQRAIRRVAIKVFGHLHALIAALSPATPDWRGIARYRAWHPRYFLPA